MDYHKQYCQLLLKAKAKGLVKLDRADPCYAYYEEHHILPRSMGGDDSTSNIAVLTPREHFIAHWLLTKFTSGVDYYRMLLALQAMSTNKDNRKLTSRQYEVCKNAISKANALLVAVGLHNFQSEANRLAVIASNKARTGMPCKWSASAKAKRTQAISEGLHSLQAESVRKHNSFKAIERNKVSYACPHCGAVGKGPNMQRYHFGRCLEHPDNVGLTRKQIKDKRKQL